MPIIEEILSGDDTMTVIQHQGTEPRVTSGMPVRSQFQTDADQVDCLPLMIMELRRRHKERYDSIRDAEALMEQMALQSERQSVYKAEEAMTHQKAATFKGALLQAIGGGVGVVGGVLAGGLGAAAGRAAGAVRGVEFAVQASQPASNVLNASGQLLSAEDQRKAEYERVHGELAKSTSESGSRAGGRFQDGHSQLLAEVQRLCEELNQGYMSGVKAAVML
ncbi:hypothetical protein [Paracidovorax citrulli]